MLTLTALITQLKVVRNGQLEDINPQTASGAIPDLSTAIQAVINSLGGPANLGTAYYKTAAVLLTENPVLEEGQIGIESDTFKTKFGDGETEWSLLPYASLGNNEAELYILMDTASNLNNANPVVPNNTFIIETDTERIRSGNGILPYTSLGYIRYSKQVAGQSDTTVRCIGDYSTLLTLYNITPGIGQTVVELDTRKYKVGNGQTPYNTLSYKPDLVGEATDGASNIPIMDSLENLTTEDPVLADGQLCIVIETTIISKMGDGRTTFMNLDEASLQMEDDQGNTFVFDGYTDENGVTVMPESNDETSIDNPVLEDGVIYVERGHSYSLRIGDGVTPFTELSESDSYDRIPAKLFIFDTATNFVSVNPVVKDNRVAIETDTNKVKLGNGITTWEYTRYQETLSLS